MIASLSAAAERWRLVLITSISMGGLLILGLLARFPFIAEATLDIGGVLTVGGGANCNEVSSARFTPFEGGRSIEMFFEHMVFHGSSGRLSECGARATYSPEGERVKLVCKGRSDREVRALVAAAIEPFLERHSRHFELAKYADEQRRKILAQQLSGAKLKIDVLQRRPVSSIAEAQIIGHRLEIETIHHQMAADRLLGERVKATRVDDNGVKVIDRTPGWNTWLVVMVMAIGSGVFVGVLATRLDGVRNE